MMGTYGGKPCQNCGVVLKPPKWEDWLVVPIFFVPFILSQYFGDMLEFWKTASAVVIFALIYVYLIAVFIPWKIQPKSKL